MKIVKVLVLSDGTGETASSIIRAALTQFQGMEVYFSRFKSVRSLEQVDAIFKRSAPDHQFVVHTMVSKQVRHHVHNLAKKLGMVEIDILGPILEKFEKNFETQSLAEPGLLHAVNDQYFRRVEAIEFTLRNDDGKTLEGLHEADIVLVGISRTSKTPLSIYLSMEGHKVVNIPIILDVETPPELQEIDQRKIFALTINANSLQEIRQNRLSKLGVSPSGDYAELKKVVEEIEWANAIFERNRRWPVFDVTGKALEETAAEIMRLRSQRGKPRFFKNPSET